MEVGGCVPTCKLTGVKRKRELEKGNTAVRETATFSDHHSRGRNCVNSHLLPPTLSGGSESPVFTEHIQCAGSVIGTGLDFYDRVCGQRSSLGVK